MCDLTKLSTHCLHKPAAWRLAFDLKCYKEGTSSCFQGVCGLFKAKDPTDAMPADWNKPHKKTVAYATSLSTKTLTI